MELLVTAHGAYGRLKKGGSCGRDDNEMNRVEGLRLTAIRTGLGVTAGYTWWYGYHVPATRKRDNFYQKLEDQRAKAIGSA
jgi:hypothetical protein